MVLDDDRVEGTVDVTKPSGNTVEFWGDMAGLTMNIQNVCHEERQPADYKSP